MEAEIKKFNLFHLNVKITEPFIYILHVLLLNIFELICRKINCTIQYWHLELARIDLEISIDDWECAPTNNDILRDVLFRRKVYDFKHDYI